MKHGLTLTQDWDGHSAAECECGWVGPPCSDIASATDSYRDHLIPFVLDMLYPAVPGDAGENP
jgi:hypothetical protein